MALPNGQTLWFRVGEARRFGNFQTALGSQPTPRRVAVMLAGGGIHHFFRTQRIGRHWWYLPEFVRPWEMLEIQRALLGHEFFLIGDLGQSTGAPTMPGVLSLWLPLPRPMAEHILPHLKNPRHFEGVGDLLEVQP